MKTFKQIVENIVVLDEAVMDQKMWDQTKKGDKLTISYDSGIKKGNKATFVVGTKNIVGKARVGKITMKREDGKGGKFFLYNRNGNISLALGDMAASMTGLVKESVEVELDERNYAKEYANYHSRPEQIANRSSRNKARRIMAKENDVDGMDVGHADNNPLNNDPANLRIENPSDNRREPRMRSEGKQAKYPLYHKDFSGAMKTAYDHAKKNLGVIVDPSEIDDKVAMGPRKPSTGKTNSYRLTDKSGKKAIQVQVYNTGKSYELNMYKEDLDFVYEAVVTYEDDYDTIVNITIEKDKFMYAMGRDKPQDIAKRYPWKNSANLILEPTMYKRSRSWDDVHQYLLRFLGNKRGMDSAIRQVFSHNDAPIIYKEEVELDLAEGFSPAQIDKLRKQYKSLPDRLSTDQAMKLGKVLKGMPKDQLIAIARADIKWLSSSAVTNLIIQGVKASEINEEVQLDEAFKAGGLKLKDGKQVLVKKDDAMMLNDLMKQLSKPNVKKMTDTLMKNKKGYAEILGFAKDSHE